MKRKLVNIDSLFQEGFKLHKSGDICTAIKLYKDVLRYAPSNYNAAHLLTVALLQNGEYSESLQAIDRLLSKNQLLIPEHSNRGRALSGLCRYEEAIVSFSKSIELDATFAEAYISRGVTYCSMRRYSEALSDFKRFVALSANPIRLSEAYANMGNIYSIFGHSEEAIVNYNKAIELNPNYFESYRGLGSLYMRKHDYVSAKNILSRLLALNPSYERAALGDLAFCNSCLADWSNLNLHLREIQEGVKQSKLVAIPFHLLVLSDNTQDIAQCARIFAQNIFPIQKKLLSTEPNIQTNEGSRIKIAYLSADLYAHATAFLMAELFELHDRRRFDIHVYSFGVDHRDSMHMRVEQAVEHFYNVHDWTDEQIAQHIRQQNIAIVVDLKGHTGNSRTGIFAWRPAPVAVNYLGYPGTMGTDYIDYIIADHTLIPPEFEFFYTEKIARLPNSYQPNDRQRHVAKYIPTRTELGLPEKGFVFCCFNNNYKIMPPVFDIWMRLLEQIPGSVLWLLKDNPTAADNLRKEACKRGISDQRVIFAERTSLPLHLARQKQADLFLDTLPCNAHTTASDALWVGLPILTCIGKNFAARVAASLLHAVDIPELVVSSLTEYEQLALSLARDSERLSEIRAKLQSKREVCALFDTERYTRHLEQAYMQMFNRAVQGLAPKSFNVFVDE